MYEEIKPKREIKFRGQQINTKQWIYGYLYRNKGLYVICENIRYSEEEPILIDTIGQYTGLNDKNGKEIYEGDIVNIEYTETVVENAIIKYQGASFYGETNADMWELDMFYKIEVIGNIYDNPELLEKG